MNKILVALIILILSSYASYSDETRNDFMSGDEIAKKINERDEGNSVSRDLLMELIDKSGKKRVRNTVGFRKYYGEEKRTVIFYKSPKNIKDTAFLTYDYPEVSKDDDQWLYLPALRKVRRISASDRGDYFLGTDFTYEDIKLETRVSIDDYNRKTVGIEIIDGKECYIVESVPVSEKVAKELGYGKIRSWIDNSIWITRKAEFFDIRQNPLKTTYVKDIKQVQGIWTPHKMTVENHKTGHKTVFTFSNIDYKSKVRDDLFTERALKRGI